MLRTHTCGELTAKEAGKTVTLCGWVDTLRASGKIGFLLLRDRYGITQVFLNPELTKQYGTLSKESVVLVEGEVKKRPENQVKKEMKTGEIELSASRIKDKWTLLLETQRLLGIIRRTDTLCQIHKQFADVPYGCNIQQIGCA